MRIVKHLMLLLALGALFYVVYRIGPGNILSVLPKALNPRLLLVFGIYYFTIFLRGVRWRIMLRESISYPEAFKIVFSTAFFNLVSPVRMGELWRIKKCSRFGLGRVTTATIVERSADVFVTILIAIAAFSTIGIGFQSQILPGAIGAGLLLVLAFVGLTVMQDKRFWNFVGRYFKIGKNEHRSVKELLANRWLILKAVVVTFFIWGFDVFNFYNLANIIAPISIGFVAIALLVSALLGSSIISQVAVAQVLLMIGILSLKVPYASAAAIAILMGIVYYWIQIPIGYLIYTRT